MVLANVTTEADLAGLAVQLGAARSPALLSEAERNLVAAATREPAVDLELVVEMISQGLDPLGETFLRLRPQSKRRDLGATYTPPELVETILSWAKKQGNFARVIDVGAGSGRFTIAAAKAFPDSTLFPVEVDPLASLCLRASLTAAQLENRSQVRPMDFCSFIPDGLATTPHNKQEPQRTLWIGNPPYVRHHSLTQQQKQWLKDKAAELGYKASALAGLHIYFFVNTALHAQRGDVGLYITSSEWLDVNYGALARNLLLQELGLESLDLLSPKSLAFEGVATTSVVTCFKPETSLKQVRIRQHETAGAFGELGEGDNVEISTLRECNRWSTLFKSHNPIPDGYIELGEICRVHRGAVTGANKVFLHSQGHPELPTSVLKPSVTRAKELFSSNGFLDTCSHLRNVIGLPSDLDELDESEREAVNAFLIWASERGAHKGYVAQKRKSWWSVRIREPAPILASYMARRPPTFVRNLVSANHINIAHGIYPREPMTSRQLDELAASLRRCATLDQGRTYAGGLTKFEPREMQRIAIPNPMA